MLVGLGPLGGGLFAPQLRQSSSFWPGVLFAGGAEGVWLDPSDLSTLFQDVAGTTPVTGWGPGGGEIGGALDAYTRQLRFTQATAAGRPLLGRTVAGGRRNHLRHTASLDDPTSWPNSVAVTSAGAAPTGPAFQLLAVVDGLFSQLYQVITSPPGGDVVDSWVVKAGSTSWASVSVFDGGGQRYEALFDLAAGQWATVAPELTALPPLSLGDGWYRLAVHRDRGSPPTYAGIVVAGATGPDGVLAGDSILVATPQLEAGTAASPVQIVGNAYDVTEAGQPELKYLFQDRVDDYLSAGSFLEGYSGPYTFCYGVLHPDSASSFIGAGGDSPGAAMIHGRRDISTLTMAHYSNDFDLPDTHLPGVPTVECYRYTHPGGAIWKNGNKIGESTLPNNLAVSSPGFQTAWTTQSAPWRIYGIVGTLEALPDETIAAISAYLASKAGIVL